MGCLVVNISTARRSFEFLRSLQRDDDGQDLVEYALLCATVGLVGVAAWSLIEQRLGVAYQGYETAQQNLWEPAEPQ